MPEGSKEVIRKYDEENGRTFIIYDTSKGVIIVDLAHVPLEFRKDSTTYDKNLVGGIGYLKEI